MQTKSAKRSVNKIGAKISEKIYNKPGEKKSVTKSLKKIVIFFEKSAKKISEKFGGKSVKKKVTKILFFFQVLYHLHVGPMAHRLCSILTKALFVFTQCICVFVFGL